MSNHVLPDGQLVGQRFRIPATTEYEFDGAGWTLTETAPKVYRSSGQPSASVIQGDIWVDVTSTDEVMYNYDGLEWKPISGDRNKEWIVEEVNTDVTIPVGSWFLYKAEPIGANIRLPLSPAEGTEIKFLFKAPNGDKRVYVKSQDGNYHVKDTDTGSDDYPVKSGNMIEFLFAGGHWNIRDADVDTVDQVTGNKNWTIVSNDGDASAGDRCLVDTSVNAVTITLPLSPELGDTIKLAPYRPTYHENNLIVANNTNNINGQDTGVIVDQLNLAVEFRYIGGAIGWAMFKMGDTVIIEHRAYDFSHLPVYADDAAASVGGLSNGEGYVDNAGYVRSKL